MSKALQPKIIKQSASLSQVSTTIFNLEDLKQQCEIHLVDVRQRTRVLIDDAKSDANALRDQARREGERAGYEAGYQQGREQAAEQVHKENTERTQEQIEQLEPVLRAIVGEFEKSRRAWILKWEIEAVELSLAIAEKVIRSRLQSDSALGLKSSNRFSPRTRLNPCWPSGLIHKMNLSLATCCVAHFLKVTGENQFVLSPMSQSCVEAVFSKHSRGKLTIVSIRSWSASRRNCLANISRARPKRDTGKSLVVRGCKTLNWLYRDL